MSNTIDMSAFLDAVNILVQKATAGKYSQTTKGVVTEVTGTNKYSVSVDSDNSFIAQSIDSNISYAEGDSVYILYTNNTSLGVVNYILGKESEDIDLAQRYNMVVHTLTQSLFDLNATKSIKKGQANLEITILVPENENTWNTFIEYLQKTRVVKFLCNFTTDFTKSPEDVGKATYGLLVTMTYVKEGVTKKEIKEINNFSMLGNPYFYENHEQDLVLEVSSEIIPHLTSFKVELFLKNAKIETTQICLNSFHLYIGEYDLNKKLKVGVNTSLEGFAITTGSEVISIDATAKLKDDINESVMLNNVKYFWFIKDINYTEPEYTEDGEDYGVNPLTDIGWRCLNEKEPYTLDGKTYPNFIGTGPNFTLVNTDATHYENVYKCVARYVGTNAKIVIRDSDEFKLYNFNEVNFTFGVSSIKNEMGVEDNNLTFIKDTDQRVVTFSVTPNSNKVKFGVYEEEVEGITVEKHDYDYQIFYRINGGTEQPLDKDNNKNKNTITVSPTASAFQSYIFILKVTKIKGEEEETNEFGSLDLLFTNSISPTEKLVTETVYQLTNGITPPESPKRDYNDSLWSFTKPDTTDTQKYLWKSTRRTFWIEYGDSFQWGGFQPWSIDDDYFLTADKDKQNEKTYYKLVDGKFVEAGENDTDVSILYEQNQKTLYKRETVGIIGQEGKYIFIETDGNRENPDSDYFYYNFEQMEQNPADWTKPECIYIHGADSLAVEQLNIFNQLTSDGKLNGFFYSDEDQSGYFLTTDETIRPEKTYFTYDGDKYIPVTITENNKNSNPKDEGWYEYFNRLYINATWIKTGALTVADNNGNILFQADMSNKTVSVGESVVFKAGESVFSGKAESIKDVIVYYKLYAADTKFTYQKTQDTTLNPNKTYYDDSEDKNIIAEPVEENIRSYWEQTPEDKHPNVPWSTTKPTPQTNYHYWQKTQYIFANNKTYYTPPVNETVGAQGPRGPKGNDAAVVISQVTQYFLNNNPYLDQQKYVPSTIYQLTTDTTRVPGKIYYYKAGTYHEVIPAATANPKELGYYEKITLYDWVDIVDNSKIPIVKDYYRFKRQKTEYNKEIPGFTETIQDTEKNDHYIHYSEPYLDETDRRVVDWCSENDSTFIDGGHIYAHSISAERLAVNAIQSLTYTPPGWKKCSGESQGNKKTYYKREETKDAEGNTIYIYNPIQVPETSSVSSYYEEDFTVNPYSNQGSFFDLNSGKIVTPVFSIFPYGKGSLTGSPEAYFKGHINAQSGTIGGLEINRHAIQTSDYGTFNTPTGERITVNNSESVASGLIYERPTAGTVRIIGVGSFNGTHLVIPEDVTDIAEYAFKDCTWIKKITFEGFSYSFTGTDPQIKRGSSNLRSIGKGAFMGCTSLEHIELPFIGISKNTYSTKHKCFGGIFGANSYQENGAFVPSSLKRVVIYNNHKELIYNEFYECSNIEEIVFNSEITCIGNTSFPSTFYHCTNLLGIYVNSTYPAGSSIITTQRAFNQCYGTGFFTIDNSVELQISGETNSINKTGYTYNYKNANILRAPFYRDSSDKYAEPGISTTYLPKWFVANGINYMYYPTGSTNIGNAYVYRQPLGKKFAYIRGYIDIPNSNSYFAGSGHGSETGFQKFEVKFIGTPAFTLCENLEELYLPASLDAIYVNLNNLNIKRIYFKGSEAAWNSITFHAERPSSNIVYFYDETGEKDGNYWHYSNEGLRISGNSDDGYIIDSEFFKVNKEGKIFAEGGKIGGWEIGEGGSGGKILFKRTDSTDENGSGSVTTGVAALNNQDHVVFWAGCPGGKTPWEYNQDGGDYTKDTPFFVTSLGYLRARDGKIGCVEISEDSISSKKGETTQYEFTPNGIYMYEGGNLVLGSVSFKTTQQKTETLTTGQYKIKNIDSAGETISALTFGGTQGNKKIEYNLYLKSKGTGSYFSPSAEVWLEARDLSGKLINIPTYEEVKYYASIQTWGFNYTSAGLNTLQIPAGQSKSQIHKFTATYDVANRYLRVSQEGDGTSASGNAGHTDKEVCMSKSEDLETIWEVKKEHPEPSNFIEITGHLIPTETTGGYNLGTSEQPWHAVFTSTGTVSKSDRNSKNTICPLNENHSFFFDNLTPVSYKFNDGTSERTHFGLIAQDVEQALIKTGLTTKDFAGICYWDKKDGTKGYGLRYEEFISLNIFEIQKLKKQIKELEEKILLQ